MFVFQFTTIVYTSGKISLHIFQLVCHAYKMASVYIWIPYSRTIFKYRTDERVITSNLCGSVCGVQTSKENIGRTICFLANV